MRKLISGILGAVANRLRARVSSHVTVYDFVQGRLGNCGMVAAMAGLAKDRELRGRVVPWASCGIGRPSKVTFKLFKLGEAREVEVVKTLPKIKNKLAYCRSSNGSLLGPLLEKALVQLLFDGNYKWSESVSSCLVMASLTNNFFEDFRASSSDLRFEKLLSHGLKTKCHMVAWFLEPPQRDLIGYHVYSLVGEKKSEVTLYDPHGKIVKVKKDLFIGINSILEVSYPENKIFRIPDVKTRVDLTGNWLPLKVNEKMHFTEYDLLVEDDDTEILVNVIYRHHFKISARIFIIANDDGTAVVKSSVFKRPKNYLHHSKSLRENLRGGKYKVVVAVSKRTERASCADCREYLERFGGKYLLRVAASKHCLIDESAKKETGNILFDFLHFV